MTGVAGRGPDQEFCPTSIKSPKIQEFFPPPYLGGPNPHQSLGILHQVESPDVKGFDPLSGQVGCKTCDIGNCLRTTQSRITNVCKFACQKITRGNSTVDSNAARTTGAGLTAVRSRQPFLRETNHDKKSTGILLRSILLSHLSGLK